VAVQKQVRVLVIPTDEELAIAQQTAQVVAAGCESGGGAAASA
jgi:acetate kinase